MRRGTAACFWFTLGCCLAAALAQAQVTTRTDAIGLKLNEWFTAKSAAGLAAITYENRDDGHSQLNASEWPQLRVYVPTDQEKAAQRQKGPAGIIRPTPTIGNCSMAGPATKGGSLPRIYFLQPMGFDFLTNQYTHSNLFVYPEHQDYDPGWNGRGGWGDLYVANTPLVVISQGSSYLDQPFVRAFLSATAALPPETQEGLIRKRMLMPALQAIFRQSNRMVQREEDYFTGKAHPPVFEGSQINEEKFMRLAHEMTPEKVPPAVLLEVVQEDVVTPGKDFFEMDAVQSNVSSTAPFSIARIYRQSAPAFHMTVSAAKSLDPLRKPLQFRWELLQGDPERVTIEPAAGGTRASITVRWHPGWRAASGIQTHRVDIGVFAGNGTAWSAPSFISFYMLPNEVRFEDEQGRIQEICYENGNPDPGLPPSDDLRWLTLGRRLDTDRAGMPIRLLSKGLSEEAVVRLEALANDLAPRQEAWRELAADPGKKAEADAALAELQKELRQKLQAATVGGKHSLVEAMEAAIDVLSSAPDMYVTLQEELGGLARLSTKTTALQDITAGRKRLLDWGIFREDEDTGRVALTNDPDRLTPGEKHHLKQFQLTVLSQAVLPGFLERSTQPAFVDPLLTTPKAWRDIYIYGKDGEFLGWTRRANGRRYEFDAEGRFLPEGRALPPVEVRYARDAITGRLLFAPK